MSRVYANEFHRAFITLQQRLKVSEFNRYFARKQNDLILSGLAYNILVYRSVMVLMYICAVGCMSIWVLTTVE